MTGQTGGADEASRWRAAFAESAHCSKRVIQVRGLSLKKAATDFRYASDLDAPRKSVRFHAMAIKTFGDKTYIRRQIGKSISTPLVRARRPIHERATKDDCEG
jgi:hypothetical protein